MRDTLDNGTICRRMTISEIRRLHMLADETPEFFSAHDLVALLGELLRRIDHAVEYSEVVA